MAHLVDANEETPPVPQASGGAGQFLRFCGVGGVGFVVDAMVLMSCIHIFGVGAIPARVMSAGVAILTTFELNRRWAFRAARPQNYGRALATYVGVQGFGLAFNVTVYAGCHLLLPAPLNDPLSCLVAASGAALLINYAGARRLVFRAKSR